MIVIVDYGMGNLGSILNMLKKIGAPAKISSRPEEMEQADKLILPGVGAFDSGMQQIEAKGLLPVLNRRVLEQGVPVLGICLGMQLLARKSEEGTLPGLGWVEADVKRFKPTPEKPDLKIPHMGWNFADMAKEDPLFAGLEKDPRFYFVHSYYVSCQDPADVLATARHGLDFVAALSRKNIMGTQFHPEKSHKYGMRLLSNFAVMS